MDPPAEDVADSRSNVVGRKRALHTSSEQDRDIVSIDSSSDESAIQPRKRARQDKKIPSTESSKVEVDLTSSSPLQQVSAGTVKCGAIGQPVAWNQGVQSGLRTSFQSKKLSLSKNAFSKQPEQDSNNSGQGFFTRQGFEVNSNTVEKSQGTSNQKSITKKQLNKLPEKRQLAVMTANTKYVSTLIDLHGWPVPKQFQQRYIEEGLTFYPTPKKKDQPVGSYLYSGGDVQLRELHSAEGKPIMIEDITYSDVLHALVADNEFFLQGLADKRAKNAFKAFMAHFYSHVPQKDIFVSFLVQNAPHPSDILKNFVPSSKENAKPKPKAEEFLKKSGETSSQKVTQAPPAPIVIDSEPNIAPAKTFSKSTPPALACAVDHYDTNAPQAVINDGLTEDEDAMKQNNASASISTTESNGKTTTRIAPTLVTDVIDPTRGRRILTGADTVQMDHGSSDSIVGNEIEFHSVSGSAVEVDDQNFEASRETGSSLEPTPEDLAAILKYFPTTDGVVLRRCLVCGSSGHDRAVCPENACSSCGSKGNHMTPACPRTMVCGKCRGVGHQTSHCPEKLRAAKEDIKCITCQSPSHIENECHLIWRSFHPGTDEIKKVRSISAYCYFCGRPGHFGPECGLYRGTPASGRFSWTNHNMKKYLDDTASNDETSLRGNDYLIPSRANKGFTIKGKANDPIDLDSSDDEEGFIHPKVNMGHRNGQIQFSQAVGMQSFSQRPIQFQGNAGGNPNSRAPPRNQGGRGGRGSGSGSGGSSGDRKKPKHKAGNSPSRGGGHGRGRGGRGRGGTARGAPHGRR